MLKLNKKLLTSTLVGAFMIATVSSSAFAATQVEISDNGRGSRNDVSVRHTMSSRIIQNNNADIRNSIGINSDTGNNSARDNRGGVSLRSGDVDTNVHVFNHTNMNSIGTGTGGSNGGSGHTNDWWSMNNKMLHTMMTGSQEVPGPGDPDGKGITHVKLHPAKGELCVAMHVENIEPATAAHIHKGSVGVAGPVVVTLPTPNASGHANGCVSADMTLLKAIKQNPSEYYVNVHNTPYPNGAVRGQLSQ
jgi:hypothetical protein